MAEKKSFLLRVDPELYQALRRWADSELRSINGQIEWILRDAVGRRKMATGSAEGKAEPESPAGK